MRKLLAVVLVLAAVVLCLPLLGLFLVALFVLPPMVTAVTLTLFGLVGLWVFFSRRGSGSAVTGSESALMGRQTSKEGLL